MPGLIRWNIVFGFSIWKSLYSCQFLPSQRDKYIFGQVGRRQALSYINLTFKMCLSKSWPPCIALCSRILSCSFLMTLLALSSHLNSPSKVGVVSDPKCPDSCNWICPFLYILSYTVTSLYLHVLLLQVCHHYQLYSLWLVMGPDPEIGTECIWVLGSGFGECPVVLAEWPGHINGLEVG